MKRGTRPIPGFSLKDKDESMCRNCGSYAHHSVPRSLAPSARADLRNCLPLCNECHRRWHDGRPIDRAVFTAEEWEFITSIYGIGEAWFDKRYPVAERAA